MPDIRHQIIINAKPEAIIKAVTEQEGLRAWWARSAAAQPTVGSDATFTFGDGAVVIRMRVEAIENNEVRWQCIGDIDEWRGTDLFFKARPQEDAVLLDFGHMNWASSDGAYAQCSYDWSHYMRSLKLYLETGTGVPYPEYNTRGEMSKQ